MHFPNPGQADLALAIRIVRIRDEDNVLAFLGLLLVELEGPAAYGGNSKRWKVGGACQGLRNDLEIHKRSEEALRDSEAKFRGLFESVMESVYQITLDGSILAANPPLVKMLGYDSEQELKAAGSVTNIYL